MSIMTIYLNLRTKRLEVSNRLVGPGLQWYFAAWDCYHGTNNLELILLKIYLNYRKKNASLHKDSSVFTCSSRTTQAQYTGYSTSGHSSPLRTVVFQTTTGLRLTCPHQR